MPSTVLITPKAEAAQIPLQEATTTPIDVEDIIRQAATAHHLNVDHFLAVANCEDPGLILEQQSNYMKNGKREASYGIFQINTEANDVSIASATDPVFASNWSATMWEEGQASKWTCWRELY